MRPQVHSLTGSQLHLSESGVSRAFIQSKACPKATLIACSRLPVFLNQPTASSSRSAAARLATPPFTRAAVSPSKRQRTTIFVHSEKKTSQIVAAKLPGSIRKSQDSKDLKTNDCSDSDSVCP